MLCCGPDLSNFRELLEITPSDFHLKTGAFPDRPHQAAGAGVQAAAGGAAAGVRGGHLQAPGDNGASPGTRLHALSILTLGLQTFIDQLIEDKKSISQKAESIAVEMRTTERRNRENVKAMESRHSLEMGRIKQVAFHQDFLISQLCNFF